MSGMREPAFEAKSDYENWIGVRPGDGPALYYVGTGPTPTVYRLDLVDVASIEAREKVIARALLHYTAERLES